ncbi:MAG: GTPase [Candidatus Micrarchaeia archaeon]
MNKNGLEEKLQELKEEYSRTKYNKATDKHLGILRRKIAEVKRDIIESSKGKHGKGFFVKKNGDATVALFGYPNTGKSTIINALTGTKSKVAPHAFTTLEIIPGTLVYKNAHIQIFDMPGIIEGANSGLGNGKTVISALKTVDLIAFVVDVYGYDKLGILLSELKKLNVMINKERPKVRIEKANSGLGIQIEKNNSGISDSDVKTILKSFGIFDARVSIEERLDVDEFIAIVSGRVWYIKAVAILNKIDTVSDYKSIASEVEKAYGMDVVPISASEQINIEELKEHIYNKLGLMTIYLKPKGGNPEPIILRKGATVADAAAKVHTELKGSLKCAYLTGPSAKFQNQKVGAMHVLDDGDTITFIK